MKEGKHKLIIVHLELVTSINAADDTEISGIIFPNEFTWRFCDEYSPAWFV